MAADEFLSLVPRVSKSDVAVALLGISAGAAVDVWFFPAGMLEPFNTGLYFCAAAVGAKYAAESLLPLWRRHSKAADGDISLRLGTWWRRVAARVLAGTTAREDFLTDVSVQINNRDIGRDVGSGAPSRGEIERHFASVIAALEATDDRSLGDRELCEKYKAELRAQHEWWQARLLTDDEMHRDILRATDRYRDVTAAGHRDEE